MRVFAQSRFDLPYGWLSQKGAEVRERIRVPQWVWSADFSPPPPGQTEVCIPECLENCRREITALKPFIVSVEDRW